MELAKNIVLAISIVVILSMFLHYGFSTFKKAPLYEDFCNETYRYQTKPVIEPYDQQMQRCGDVYNGPEVQNCYQQKGNPTFKYDNLTKCDAFDTCDFCNTLFQEQNDRYQRNVFIITALVGIAAIIFGMYFGIAFMSGGFLFGGILTLAAGTIRYFAAGHVDRYLRMIVLFVEILILIWIGYKKVVRKK